MTVDIGDTPIDGGEESGFNFDAAVPVTETAPATGAPAGNPAWQEALAIVPKEFQTQLTPIFEKWDKGTQTLADKARQEALAPYQPYQQFIDQKTDAQEVLAAYQVWQQLQQDPKTMYERLGALLRETGQLPPEVQAALEEELEEQQVVKDPRVDALQKQLEGMMNFLQQGQQETVIQQQAAVLDQQINQEIQQIETLGGGTMPQWLRLEVLQRASLMTDRENRPVSLMEAFQEVQQVRQQMLANRPGTQAPRVIPNGGGFPQAAAQPQSFGTLDDRTARIGEIVRQHNQS